MHLFVKSLRVQHYMHWWHRTLHKWVSPLLRCRGEMKNPLCTGDKECKGGFLKWTSVNRSQVLASRCPCKGDLGQSQGPLYSEVQCIMAYGHMGCPPWIEWGTDRTEIITFQWRIQDFQEGVPTYYLAKTCRKLRKNEGNRTESLTNLTLLAGGNYAWYSVPGRALISGYSQPPVTSFPLHIIALTPLHMNGKYVTATQIFWLYST